MVEKLPPNAPEDRLSAEHGKTSATNSRRGIPREVLEDPNLIIGMPSRLRRSAPVPYISRRPVELTPAQKTVKRALLAGRAAIEVGGLFPDTLRDELLALSRGGDGSAQTVSRWLIRKGLIRPVLIESAFEDTVRREQSK